MEGDRREEEVQTSDSDRERPCFPQVQRIVSSINCNTPPKTKMISSTKVTPASSIASGRRQQPSRLTKMVPCLQHASSQSSVNTIASSTSSVAARIFDPVQVFCRIRPTLDNQESCIKIFDDKSLVITTPESSIFKAGVAKELTYTFEKLYGGDAEQETIFEKIALPLLRDVLQGRNSLLFAYGITGSGKTYTMSGTPNEPGIMPKCLDVIFNSISEAKAMKYIFKPDKMNGFETQCSADAMLERQKELGVASVPKTPGRTRNGKGQLESDVFMSRKHETTMIPGIRTDAAYSVFVTYIEIYNNFAYDLLDENPIESRKMLREDGNHNVYLNSGVEIEVQSADEAFEAFNRGQRNRRIAHTALNTESSRSHSIFNIRLVQAPLDKEGEVATEKSLIHVSQFSLVDLAGSERYGRTGATGDRLKEAGNINSSLMTLRMCMDILRENQRTNANKLVPYRDTKLTHYLKNFFEGEGRVRMVLCINPKAEDYDENLHVLTFAELTQEVQVARPQTVPPKIVETVTPIMSKRKAVDTQKSTKRRIVEVQEREHNIIEPQVPTVFPLRNFDVGLGLGPPFPSCKMTRSDEAHVLTTIRNALQQRMTNRLELHSMITMKRNIFRARLIELENNLESLYTERNSLQSRYAILSDEKDSFENVLRTVQFEKAEMDVKIDEQEKLIRELREELENMQMETRQKEVEHLKEQDRLKQDLEREKELHELRRARQHQREEAKLKAESKEKEKTIRAVRELVSQVDVGDVSRRSRSKRSKQRDSLSTSSESDIPSAIELEHELAKSRRTSVAKLPLGSPSKGISATASNIRLRSRSTDDKGGKWLEHVAGVGVCQGTIFQPQMKKKKSVNELIRKEDVVNLSTTRYCLKTQQVDSEGEVETLLVKGDILPTRGGGAQVVFTDAETLKHVLPDRALSPNRKRPSGNMASSSSRIVDERGDAGTSKSSPGRGLGGFLSGKRSRQ